MNPTTIETTATVTDTETNADKANGLVATIFELGLAWASYGLKIGTTALEHSAKTLGITAKALDNLADDLAAKAKVQAAVKDEPVEAAK